MNYNHFHLWPSDSRIQTYVFVKKLLENAAQMHIRYVYNMQFK